MFHHRNEPDHLSDRELILLHDGELSRRNAARARRHLEACWACRCHSERIQNTVFRFVEHCDAVTTHLGSPPNQWNGFERRLTEYGTRIQRESRSGKGKTWRLRSGDVLAPAFRLRFLTSMALILCLLDGLFTDQALPAARATELLSRADYREAQSFTRLPDPVVHQRLRLTSLGRQAQWELWRSVRGVDLQSSWTGDEQLQADYLKVISANAWDANRPLSPNAFLQWQERANATVADLNRDEERGLVSIRFCPVVDAGRRESIIMGASLTLRADSLHSIEQFLRVSTRNGDREFRLHEIAYDIVRYSETPFAAPLPIEKPQRAPRPLPASPRGWSADELESAEASLRFRLHQLQVDLDLTPEVQRIVGGIRVRILVDSEARQGAILAALADLPQVTAQVWTPDNAPRAFADYVAVPISAPQTIHRTSAAMANELIRCLGSPEAANDYIDRVHGSLRAAMVPVLALERLANRYGDADYLRVPEAGRALLDRIAADYLTAIQLRSSELKGHLLPALRTCQLSDVAVRSQEADASQTWRSAGRQYAQQIRDLDAAFNLLFATQESTQSPVTTAEAVRRLSDLCNALSNIDPKVLAHLPRGGQPMASSTTR